MIGGEKAGRPFAYLSSSLGMLTLSLRQSFYDCRNLIFLPTKKMLILIFDNEGKSLPGWEVVELTKRPWGACQGLWVSQLLSSLCATPLGGAAPSPHSADARERVVSHFYLRALYSPS